MPNPDPVAFDVLCPSVLDDDCGAEQRTSSGPDALPVLPGQTISLAPGLLSLAFADQPYQTPRRLQIKMAVDASQGCGGFAWPAGQVLASYLVHRGPEYVRNRRVLELGSGTGLVGLVAALLGGNVCITDQAPLLEVMRKNVAMNGLRGCVVVKELDWGRPIPQDIPSAELILAADCVYFEPAFPLLVNTLAALSGAATEVLFCYKKRRKADKRFFTLLKKHFSWTEVTNDPLREIYSREAITLLKLRKIVRPSKEAVVASRVAVDRSGTHPDEIRLPYIRSVIEAPSI